MKVEVGMRVRAFHPATLGVVREGAVVGIGEVYVTVDFGLLGAGVFRVRPEDIVGVERLNGEK